MDTLGLDRVSTGRLTPGTLAQGLQHPLSSNRSFDMPSPGTAATPTAGATPIAARSPGTAASAAAAADAAAADADATRNSAGSIRSTRSARSSTPRGPGASAGAMSELGSLTSGSRALDRAAGGMSALIKARSDVALLRDLKIGPLLGRGSYGRVYKGEQGLQLCIVMHRACLTCSLDVLAALLLMLPCTEHIAACTAGCL
jgi:hypothetical protein